MSKFLIVFLLIVAGCFPSQNLDTGKYALAAVNNSASDTTRIMSFADDKITVSFDIGTSEIYFSIHNLTSSTLKVLVDEVSYMRRGKKCMVEHKDRDNEFIKPGKRFSDFIYPVDNIWYENRCNDTIHNFAPGTHWSFQKAVKYLAPDNFQVLVPILYDGKRLEYTFEFKLLSVR